VPDVSVNQVTQLLVDWSNGDEHALELLTPVIYQELRRLARSYMRRERSGHTLQSTALVHEAYMRLIDQRSPWQSRAHFFGVAAQMMRRILVDHAKAGRSAKRGAALPKIELDVAIAIPGRPTDIVALDDALKDLARIDPLRSRIVELRFFAGLSNTEVAEVVGLSTATVQRQWAGARAWLYHELNHHKES
jgi:RNA polymerase sigma factor (TIGR02999 family)